MISSARPRRLCLRALQYPADDANEKVLLTDAFKSLEMDIMRGDVLKTKLRIDGRDLKTVRPIMSEVHVLPRTHGSALVHAWRNPGARGCDARHR